MDNEGQFLAKIKVTKGRVIVVKSMRDNLLSRSVAVYLGLIQHVGEVSVYGELGLLKGEPVKIVLQENATPYSVAGPCRIPIPLLPRVEDGF